MKNKIFFMVFMLIWLGLVIFNFIVPKTTFSEKENRYLAKIPRFSFEKLVNGEYQEALDSYINDHFIFRDYWLKVKSQQEKLLGKTENNGVYIGKDGYLFEKFEYEQSEKENMQNVANNVNKFVDSVNIPVYFILVPNSIYVNGDKLPDNVKIADQGSIISEFYGNLNNNIEKVNVTNFMKENNDKYLYFKTDHHMTSNGAYLVYSLFNNSKGIYTKPLSEYTPQLVSDSFFGTFDSKVQMLNQESDYIVIYNNEYNTNIREAIYDNEITRSIYNPEFLNKKDKYSFFLNGNNAKVVIKTNVNNKKKVLVIKDSYAHIMVQFLCNDYEEIHLVDPRYYRLSLVDYVNDNDIDEILFLYNVSNLTKDIGLRNIK